MTREEFDKWRDEHPQNDPQWCAGADATYELMNEWVHGFMRLSNKHLQESEKLRAEITSNKRRIDDQAGHDKILKLERECDLLDVALKRERAMNAIAVDTLETISRHHGEVSCIDAQEALFKITGPRAKAVVEVKVSKHQDDWYATNGPLRDEQKGMSKGTLIVWPPDKGDGG